MDTKIAIVVRDDLAVWQKLNVTSFLTSGLVADNGRLIGDPYFDADKNQYSPLIVQPVIVLTADGDRLQSIHARALRRRVRCALYIEEMLKTSNDVANRQAMAKVKPPDMRIAGIALRNERKVVDKITKGAKMHT